MRCKTSKSEKIKELKVKKFYDLRVEIKSEFLTFNLNHLKKIVLISDLDPWAHALANTYTTITFFSFLFVEKETQRQESRNMILTQKYPPNFTQNHDNF